MPLAFTQEDFLVIKYFSSQNRSCIKVLINLCDVLFQNILIILLINPIIAFLVQDIVFQLQRLVSALARYHNDCHGILKEADVFPIEVCVPKELRRLFHATRGNCFLDKFDVHRDQFAFVYFQRRRC